MALNDRQINHSRNSPQKKSGLLELGSNDALLAENKILTQQLEEVKKEVKDLPQQIREQIQKERRHQQVNFCELCSGNHPRGYCPPPFEEEVNYVGN